MQSVLDRAVIGLRGMRAKVWRRRAREAFLAHVRGVKEHLPAELPLVSIIVPFYNEPAPFLEDCLSSLRAQSYPRTEIIVVDDGSEPSAARWARDRVAQEDGAVLLRQEANAGLPAARNRGIERARGELVTFLDSDDFLTVHSLLLRVWALTAPIIDENCAGAYGSLALSPESRRFDREQDLGADDAVLGPVNFLTANGECPFSVHAALCRTSIVRRFGGFNESMRKGAEDWDLWYRMLRAGYWFAPAGVLAGYYRQKQHSMVRALVPAHFAAAMNLVDQAFDRCDTVPGLSGDPPFLFQEGLGHHLKLAVIYRRAVYAAALAVLGGAHDGYLDMLRVVPPSAFWYLEQACPVRNVVAQAMARYHGRPWNELEKMETGALNRIVSRLQEILAG